MKILRNTKETNENLKKYNNKYNEKSIKVLGNTMKILRGTLRKSKKINEIVKGTSRSY